MEFFFFIMLHVLMYHAVTNALYVRLRSPNDAVFVEVILLKRCVVFRLYAHHNLLTVK
jgi:hypothetical protein